MVVLHTPSIPQCRAGCTPSSGTNGPTQTASSPRSTNYLSSPRGKEGKKYPHSPTNSGEDPERKTSPSSDAGRGQRFQRTENSSSVSGQVKKPLQIADRILLTVNEGNEIPAWRTHTARRVIRIGVTHLNPRFVSCPGQKTFLVRRFGPSSSAGHRERHERKSPGGHTRTTGGMASSGLAERRTDHVSHGEDCPLST